jgi:hypothetical protein
MSHSERPQSSGSARAAAPDTQSLIGLLENLVPLLLRLQAQTCQPFQFPPPDPVIQSAVLDHQAAVTFTEDIVADSLRNVSSYLETNAERYSGLEPCGAIISHAKQCFAARDYAQSFALILQVYRAVTALRVIKPDLPPIGQGAGAAGTSVH